MARAVDHTQPTAFFVQGPSPFARLIFFSVFSLALIVTDSRLHYLVEVRQGLMAALHPLQVIASAPAKMMQATGTFLTSHNQLIKSHQALQVQSLKQSEALQKLASLENENEHLRSLLGAAQRIPQTSRLGEIVHMGRDPFTQKVTVNLGSRHGILAGQAVVDGAGIVGQVTQVYPFSSEVTLITDRDLAIPVQIERSGLRAIAFGHGRDNLLDLPYLPANVDIKKGDRLVTSGIDGVYPSGLMVAEVVSIATTPDSPFAHIMCKPLAGTESHKQILLLESPQLESSTGKTVAASQKASLRKTPPNAPEAKPHETH